MRLSTGFESWFQPRFDLRSLYLVGCWSLVRELAPEATVSYISYYVCRFVLSIGPTLLCLPPSLNDSSFHRTQSVQWSAKSSSTVVYAGTFVDGIHCTCSNIGPELYVTGHACYLKKFMQYCRQSFTCPCNVGQNSLLTSVDSCDLP